MQSDAFTKIFDAIADLNAKEGPSSNIFEPKSQAREQLAKLQETVRSLYRVNKTRLGLHQLCRCLVLMGSIMIELEESEAGVVELRKAYCILQHCMNGQLVDDVDQPASLEEIVNSIHYDALQEHHYADCVEFLQVHNALAIYLSNERPDEATKILLVAEQAYQAWDRWYMSQQPGACTIDCLPISSDGKLEVDTILNQGGVQHLEVVRKRYEMDVAYTSTLFYLAQLYATSDDTRLASKYCHLTMYYQLLCKKEFERRTWATNALHLSFFYGSKFAWGEALYCLEAGQIMMSMEEAGESTNGFVAWSFGRYHMNRLQYYGSLIQDDSNNKPCTDDFKSYWKDFPIDGLRPVEKQPPIITLSEAREVFRKGEKFLDNALQFHPFESSCTQHIELLQDKVKLYTYLSVFEKKRSSKIEILQRQIDLLKDIPDQLSFNAYPIVVRQLLYDLGSLYEDLVSLSRKQRANPKRAQISLPDTAFNELVDKCKANYIQFCDTWKQPQTSVIPDILDKDSCVPFFRALIRLARLEVSYAFGTAKEEFDGIGKSIETYKRALRFAEKNFADQDQRMIVEKELTLAKEMLDLLVCKRHDLNIAHQRGFVD